MFNFSSQLFIYVGNQKTLDMNGRSLHAALGLFLLLLFAVKILAFTDSSGC